MKRLFTPLVDLQHLRLSMEIRKHIGAQYPWDG
jgi:hypothetical protein